MALIYCVFLILNGVTSARWGVLCTRCFSVEGLVSHLPALILTEVWYMLPHYRGQLQQLIRYLIVNMDNISHI